MTARRFALLAPLCAALFLLVACNSSEKRTLSRADKEKMFSIHRDSAFTYYRTGELDRAEDQIYRGLEIHEDDVELRVLLGQIMEARGTRDSILRGELVWRSLLADKDVRAPHGLAKMLERKGVLYDEAARGIASGARFTEAADPAARSTELAAEARKLWKEAETLYLRAHKTKPDDRNVLNGLQRVSALLGKDEESLSWSNKVIAATDLELEDWRKLLMRPELSVREEDRLRQNVRQIERLQVQTLLQASSVAARLGRLDEAIASLQRVAELDPSMAEAHSRQAVLFERAGNCEAALHEIDEYLRLVDLDFDHPDVNAAYALKKRCEAERSAAYR